MLFGIKKYNYIKMFWLYVKFDPIGFTLNLLYNLIDSVIPTLNIIITALFINNAISIYDDPSKLNSILLPILAIVGVKLYSLYIGVFISLINMEKNNMIPIMNFQLF